MCIAIAWVFWKSTNELWKSWLILPVRYGLPIRGLSSWLVAEDTEQALCQWLFLVPVKGGRWHIIPHLAVYTTYIPLIYCLLGGYMLSTTFYGNQKQPLILLGIFSGTPKDLGPPYGKRDPYHSHTGAGILMGMGVVTIGGPWNFPWFWICW